MQFILSLRISSSSSLSTRSVLCCWKQLEEARLFVFWSSARTEPYCLDASDCVDRIESNWSGNNNSSLMITKLISNLDSVEYGPLLLYFYYNNNSIILYYYWLLSSILVVVIVRVVSHRRCVSRKRLYACSYLLCPVIIRIFDSFGPKFQFVTRLILNDYLFDSRFWRAHKSVKTNVMRCVSRLALKYDHPFHFWIGEYFVRERREQEWNFRTTQLSHNSSSFFSLVLLFFFFFCRVR